MSMFILYIFCSYNALISCLLIPFPVHSLQHYTIILYLAYANKNINSCCMLHFTD